jgi:excisionase family DNA binding protein
LGEEVQQREFISTGKAAEICSVTPDTVLKWIKSGKLPAKRTPGGHYRVNRKALQAVIESGSLPARARRVGQPFQFCWEYYEDNGGFETRCRECIVYRSRASRCYEMIELPAESGHSRLHCEGACEDCEYFKVVRGQQLNVLLITRQKQLKKEMEHNLDRLDFNLRLVESEYHCSMAVESFRPDYVVIDCSIGKKECASFTKYLSEDTRVPYVKIILAGDSHGIPSECNRLVFAVMSEPFSISELENLIGLAKLGRENRR